MTAGNTPGIQDLEVATADELADWLITQLREICDTAGAEADCRLGNHALFTLARLGGFIPSAPLSLLLMQSYDWILRVQANQAAGEARAVARLRKCGARRKRDGSYCIAKPLVNGRCKFHGGMSRGPKTAEGRLRALANLRQNHVSAPRERNAEPHHTRAR